MKGRVRLGRCKWCDDYKELLEMPLIFLGDPSQSSGRNITLQIYVICIYIFRIFPFCNQLPLFSQYICICAFKFYIKIWFDSIGPIKCPNQDFNFLPEVPTQVNYEMVYCLKKSSSTYPFHSYLLYKICDISWFVPIKTKELLSQFNLKTNLIHLDPLEWEANAQLNLNSQFSWNSWKSIIVVSDIIKFHVLHKRLLL